VLRCVVGDSRARNALEGFLISTHACPLPTAHAVTHAQTAGRCKRVHPSEILQLYPRSGRNRRRTFSFLFVPFPCLFLLHNTHTRTRVMMGAASHEGAILRTLCRSFCSTSASSTSRPASARIHRFHTTSRNWPPRTRTCQNLLATREPLSRPNTSNLFPAPSTFIRHGRPFSSTRISRHEHLDPPKPGEEYGRPYTYTSALIPDH
jgi:hypothetical protein